MSNETPLAKITFDNLRQHLGPQPKADGETDAAYSKRVDKALRAICGRGADGITNAMGWSKARRPPTLLKLIEGAVCLRWNGCSHHTFNSFMNGRRKPTLESHPKFFDDLRTYGAAKFGEDGVLDPSTLDLGPDYITFRRISSSRADRRAAS